MQLSRSLIALLVVVLSAAWGCAMLEDKTPSPTRQGDADEYLAPAEIELEQMVRFFPAGSAEVIHVDPGRYRVHATNEEHLRLVSESGVETIVPAQLDQHEADIAEPVADVDILEGDELHIVLFRPDGSVLDAVGSLSGVFPRGGWQPQRQYRRRPPEARKVRRVRRQGPGSSRTGKATPREGQVPRRGGPLPGAQRPTGTTLQSGDSNSANVVSVEITYRDPDYTTRKGVTQISVIKTPQGCEYRLEFNSPAQPPSWGIVEVGGNQGPPQRHLSAQCIPPRFTKTEKTNEREFEEQTMYFWSKLSREYARERLWITPPGWTSGPIKFANDALGPNVLAGGGFSQACFPTAKEVEGCMRAWPGEGPRIHIKAGHVRAGLSAHEYGHYAAGYVFGHMDTLGFSTANCAARSFQEAIAGIFNELLLHGTRYQQLRSYYETLRREALSDRAKPGGPNSKYLGGDRGPVSQDHTATWTNACGSDDYSMGAPLIFAFMQALWGSDHTGKIIVPDWQDERRANVTMANAFVYALAMNKGHRIDLLAYAILEWLSQHTSPQVSSKITEIFESHKMSQLALGAHCSEHSECRSGGCDAGMGTSRTNTCVPPNGTGRIGDHCSHDAHCGSSICAGLRASGNRWIPGRCGDKVNLGGSCREHNECRSGACDAGMGTSRTDTCVPRNGTGRSGDHCSHDAHCRTNICAGLRASGNQWIPGSCADKAGLGDSCREHNQCRSGACDAGMGTSRTDTCVPRNGTGRSGDHCSHDAHCRPGLACRGLRASGNRWIPGQCGG